MQLKAEVDDPPLCVDLDGTLVRTDLLVEGLFALIRHQPWLVFMIPFWLLKGRANLKQEVARRVIVDPGTLPYEQELLDLMQREFDAGRRIELVTASDRMQAEVIARHLGTIDEVRASDGETNLKGRKKADHLAAAHGVGGFDYAGDAHADLPVWKAARRSILVNPAAGVMSAARRLAEVNETIGTSGPRLREYLRALRPHQWVKNLLVFVPLVLAHRIDEPTAWLHSGLAFLAFCLCASGVYLVNDLLDAPSDRKHPTKRYRPIAAGTVDLTVVPGLIPVLLLSALAVAGMVSHTLVAIVALYLTLTTAYSLVLKRKMLWDVMALAALYTIRIFAGAVAIEKELSFWLLAFSVFIFLSLALVKRYVELNDIARTAGRIGETREPDLHALSPLNGNRVNRGPNDTADQAVLRGRGYRLCDLETLHQMGIASCFSAALVFALYVHSDSVIALYSRPEILWLICPALLYLQLRFWMLSRRGEMHEDPVVFALRDLRSQLVLVGIAIIMMVAAL